jgi:TonB family protein
MHHWFGAAFASMVLSVPVVAQAVELPPVPENPLQAQTVFGFNPKTRCPDLRITDEGTVAVVVFWLPSSGIPSQIAIKASSGSNDLDTATLACVARLRFAAATTPGNGDPIGSWQQLAFAWAHRAVEPTAVVAAATEATGGEKQDAASVLSNSVTVHACVDEAGKLKQNPTIVRSSGIAALDQAAVNIAVSGSAYYGRPTSLNRLTAPGCVQLEIKFGAQ